MYELKGDYFNSLYDPNNIKQVLHRCGAEGLTLAEVVMEPVDEALLELVDVADQHGGEVGLAEVRGAVLGPDLGEGGHEGGGVEEDEQRRGHEGGGQHHQPEQALLQRSIGRPEKYPSMHRSAFTKVDKHFHIFIKIYLCTANAYKQTYER